MKEEKKKDGRGGARPGAGRPRENAKILSFRAPEDMVRFLEGKDKPTDYIRQSVRKAMNEEEREPDFSRIGSYVKASDAKSVVVPFFENTQVVAGFPIPLDNDEKAQDIDIIKMLCPTPESHYIIRVSGDSMIDANINDGDILLVDRSNRNPDENEPAMCELNGEYTVKFVRVRDGKGYLVPANPNYPEWKISESDDFSVWGVVTYIIHKARQ